MKNAFNLVCFSLEYQEFSIDIKAQGTEEKLLALDYSLLFDAPNQNHLTSSLPWVMSLMKDLTLWLQGIDAKKDTPFFLAVSEHTKKVLNEVQKIPLGTTKTYQEIAKVIHSSPRAVGTSLSKNPIPLLIPCHRVVSKSGLGGYSHESFDSPKSKGSLELKRFLLKLEGALD